LAALRRWETFPVDSAPRPLILTAPPIRFEGRFLSEQAKLAFTYGDIRTSVPLPDGLMAILGESEAELLPAAGKRRWKKPMRITQAHLDKAEFATDRGIRELPAWRLTGPEVSGALWVLDPGPASHRWLPPKLTALPGPPRRSPASAVIENDDLTLHYTFTGSPQVEYPTTETIESSRALIILPVTRRTRGVTSAVWQTALGVQRTTTAKLASALGNRVLINLDASPVMVEQQVSG
jgi:hypothetical protein